jgi:hypothetical protein
MMTSKTGMPSSLAGRGSWFNRCVGPVGSLLLALSLVGGGGGPTGSPAAKTETAASSSQVASATPSPAAAKADTKATNKAESKEASSAENKELSDAEGKGDAEAKEDGAAEGKEASKAEKSEDGGKINAYPEKDVADFKTGCVESSKAKLGEQVAGELCSCTITGFQTDYTHQEFMQLMADQEKYKAIAAEIVQGCAKKQS